MTNSAFLEAFDNCTLPAAAWTHEAHIRMAWLMLDRWQHDKALTAIRRGIIRYNDKVLKKHGGYHETITVVFTRLIAWGRMTLPVDHQFADFKAAFPLLFDNKLTALYRYYRRDTLMSDLARSRFIEPDMEPLPELANETTAQECSTTQQRQHQRQ